MAAPVVTTNIIEETDFRVVVVCTGTFTDTQETTALKVDADNLGNGGVYPGKTPTLFIKRAQWSCSAGGIVNVLFGASSNALALQLGGAIGDEIFEPAITNPSGAGFTGDILFTTSGFASGGSYQVILTLEKSRASYTTAPLVSTLTINDVFSGVYVTGNVFSVLATFNQPINVYDGATPYVELVMAGNSTTGRATLDPTNPVVSTHPTGASTKYAVFNYKITSGDAALAGGVTLGHIVGINGSDIGQLNVIDSLPALANIATFTVN